MANTYGIMQTRIADELDRADLTSQIQNAIQDAIGFYERKYFYFTSNSGAFQFNTIAGQEYYTSSDNPLIATVPEIYSLRGTFFGLRRVLTKRQWEFLDAISTLTTSKAMPQDWAYNGEQIRLYPIPDNVYAMNAAGDPRPARPAVSTDAGVWMNDAEVMIRTKAKIYMLKNVIRASSSGEADLNDLKEQLIEEEAVIKQETASREATGVLVPSQF